MQNNVASTPAREASGDDAIVPAGDGADAASRPPVATPQLAGQPRLLTDVLVYNKLGRDLNLIIIKRLCTGIESYLHSMLLQRLPCPSWSDIVIDFSDNSPKLLVKTDEAYKKIILPAVGEISVVPREHAPKVLTHWGIEFFMLLPKGSWTSADMCNPYVAVQSQSVRVKTDKPLMIDSTVDDKVYISDSGEVSTTAVQGADEATITIPTLVPNPEADSISFPARLTVSKAKPAKPVAAAIAALAQLQKLAPSSKTMLQNIGGAPTPQAAVAQGDELKKNLKTWSYLLA